ncbi:DUF2919 domain-containing protein [Psychromonas sp. B3M02]|uniref:DUF2919 domain-containing protein n=1 Tax=Psychromonas sp. B3M02 TaxID=2267226 RepID=UPI000DEAA408|nr:DUF2919 domain-containing protein [Psychromonas sp. B3M02]RBW47167.1 DUF2919 domain-containing protein [Psychromonas sp. B3M02]
MKTRLYALKHYTEAGDLKTPPLFIYLLFFLSRTWILLIISLASQQTGDKLLMLFYPEQMHFYTGLLVGFLPVLVFLISGRRHAQKKWAITIWPACYYLMVMSLLADLLLQLYYLTLEHFQYSVSASLQLVIVSWATIYVFKSKHLRDSFKQ